MHTQQSLTRIISNNVKLKCKNVDNKSLDKVYLKLSGNTLLAYQDFNNQLYINTDARNFQLGVVKRQGIRPIVFYGRNLTGPQTRYTVTWKEIIRIVETMQDFCTISLCQRLKIYT